MTTAMVINASRIATVDLIDEITVTADPILVLTIGIDVIIAAITAAMTDATTTVVTTALISAIEVIIVMIATTIVTTTGATISVAVKPQIFIENLNPCTIAIVPGSVAIAYRTSHR
jgi:hypothetical protein